MRVMNKTLSTKEVRSIFDRLENQDIFLSCGYGGMMFIEIGQMTEHRYEHEVGKWAARKYGEYRLFCDENWNFSNGDTINIDRWTSSSFETDNLFESLGVCKLEQIEIVNDFEKTIFHISGGFTFSIIRDDSINTFSISMIPDKKMLTVFGNGNIEYKDYEEDLSYLKNRKPRPKATKNISIDRIFLRDQMPDVLPLSYEKAQEFIFPVFNRAIQSIEVDSGTRFSLNFGEDCRQLLSKKDQKTWKDPLFRWRLSVDENWVLLHDKKVCLDVRETKFHFGEKLTTFLTNKILMAVHFDKNGANAEFQFTNGYTLVILESGRYSRWDIRDFKTGLTVGSYRDEGFVYRVSEPLFISGHRTGDVNLDAMLYDLSFYREYFEKDAK